MSSRTQLRRYPQVFPSAVAHAYYIPKLACSFAYPQMILPFVVRLNHTCLLKCNPSLRISAVAHVPSSSRTLQYKHFALRELENQISLFIPDKFSNNIVSLHKVLRISQAPNFLFFIIYTNCPITGEVGKNGNSHHFFQLPLHQRT